MKNTLPSDKELLQKAEELQKEGQRVVESLGILKMLWQISKPALDGSIVSGLMVWPDIDIHAEMDDVDIRKVTDLMEKFALMPTIQKVQFNNYRELRRDWRKDRVRFPQGYYLGLRSVQPSGEWKIDIWFAKTGTLFNDYDVPALSNITEEQRVAILRLKALWLGEESGYKDGAISIDFYEAVFDRGVRTEEDFKEYLESKT